MPLPDQAAAIEQTLRNPCVALLRDRARTARADFNVHSQNVADVVELCRLVEGVPLALDLAAARVRTHRPRVICEALQGKHWSVLSRTEPRAAEAGRHGCVEALIGWSWNLLDAQRRSLLARMTVFRGGWTVYQAATVSRLSEPECQSLLGDLVRAYPVQSRSAAPNTKRFYVLLSVRDVVAAYLESGDVAEKRVRHRACFLALAAAKQGQHRAVDEADIPHCVCAISTAIDDQDLEAAHEMAMALRAHWEAPGCSPEAFEALHHIRSVQISSHPASTTTRRSIASIGAAVSAIAGT